MADENDNQSPPEAEPKDDDASLGDHARELREEFSPSKLNESLEEKVRERPLLDHLLDLAVVGRAVIIAVVVALIAYLLLGPVAAAILLVLVFFGTWYGLANRSYEQRRETQPANGDDDEEDDRS